MADSAGGAWNRRTTPDFSGCDSGDVASVPGNTINPASRADENSMRDADLFDCEGSPGALRAGD